jgi:glutamate dehydrogenase
MKDDGTIPQFYQDYVKQVQKVIKENATLEFEAIWREHEATRQPRSILSDTLSIAITKMDEELQKSTLWDDVPFRHQVLSDALPNLLLEKIGLQTILKRVSVLQNLSCSVCRSIHRCQIGLPMLIDIIQVPENYLRAIFGSYLASRFIYKHGINASQVAFFSL